jgi:multimeric flavodoxin WrbA
MNHVTRDYDKDGAGALVNITILNGEKKGRSFATFMKDFEHGLARAGHGVTVFTIPDMRISYCTGCWDCWIKTPGVCALRDDTEKIYPVINRSELLIFASPLVMGFVNAETRKINERLIPLLLPYVDWYKGECHHFLRYGHSPKLGLIIQPEPDTDDEDIAIVEESYGRTALNFKSMLVFTALTTRPVTEALDAVNGL